MGAFFLPSSEKTKTKKQVNKIKSIKQQQQKAERDVLKNENSKTCMIIGKSTLLGKLGVNKSFQM